MTVLVRIAVVIALVVYLLVWMPMLFIVLVTWDEPLHLVGWVILLVNPLTIGLAGAWYTRMERRTRSHG